MAAQLTESARQFLAEPRFAVMGTVNPDGRPQLSVIWYLLRGDEIVMNTAAGRLKDRNLRRDPRVSLCIADGYRYITIYGQAQLNDDQQTAQQDILALAVRYHGEEAGARQAAEMYSKQQRVTIRVPIERVVVYGF